jgi:four helix bundle protein
MREALKKRTKQFALAVMALEERLPHTQTARVIFNQLLRSSSSVGANYRAACRAKSSADFTAKIDIVEEEADESCYWLELFEESGTLPGGVTQPILKEANELTAIFTQVSITTKARHPK